MTELFEEDNARPSQPEKRDLADEIAATPWLVEKVKSRDTYAQALYGAMCNMGWQPMDVFPILKNEYWAVTWRAAGRIVAEIRNEGDYMNWYCSGNEGIVSDEIRDDLAKIGWQPYDY